MKIWILYGAVPNSPAFHSLAAWNYEPSEEEQKEYKNNYPRASYYIEVLNVATKETK